MFMTQTIAYRIFAAVILSGLPTHFLLSSTGNPYLRKKKKDHKQKQKTCLSFSKYLVIGPIWSVSFSVSFHVLVSGSSGVHQLSKGYQLYKGYHGYFQVWQYL